MWGIRNYVFAVISLCAMHALGMSLHMQVMYAENANHK